MLDGWVRRAERDSMSTIHKVKFLKKDVIESVVCWCGIGGSSKGKSYVSSS